MARVLPIFSLFEVSYFARDYAGCCFSWDKHSKLWLGLLQRVYPSPAGTDQSIQFSAQDVVPFSATLAMAGFHGRQKYTLIAQFTVQSKPPRGCPNCVYHHQRYSCQDTSITLSIVKLHPTLVTSMEMLMQHAPWSRAHALIRQAQSSKLQPSTNFHHAYDRRRRVGVRVRRQRDRRFLRPYRPV